MIKRLFIAIHPAPYITNQVKFHFKNNAEIAYLEDVSNEKPWQDKNEECQLFRYRDLFVSDEIVFPGWYGYKVLLAVFIAFVYRKRIGIFVDHINDNKYISFIQKIYLLFADDIYSASVSCQRLLKSCGFNNVKILPYGLSSESFYRFTKVPIPEDKQVFIANRFIPRKGWNTFIDSLAYLENLNLYYNIAGIGPMEEEIRQILTSKKMQYTILGWQENSQYVSQIEKCDIYVHFSDFEPFGIPPLDAYVLGKKIVVSKSTYSVEPFFEDKGVFVFDPLDPIGLARCIHKAICSTGENNAELRIKKFQEVYKVKPLSSPC